MVPKFALKKMKDRKANHQQNYPFPYTESLSELSIYCNEGDMLAASIFSSNLDILV